VAGERRDVGDVAVAGVTIVGVAVFRGFDGSKLR